MMAWFLKKHEYSRLVDRYRRLREIAWRFNNKVLPEYLSKRALETCTKKLGIWQKGTIVFENEDEMGVLADYCIHDYRDEGGTAVERYVADSHPERNSDEYAVLKAMLESFHTLVRVTDVLPGVGVRVTDLLTDCGYLLVDMGFSKTARKGLVLATRLLPYEEFVTTSGAALPVDGEILREIGHSILPQHGTDKDGQCILSGGQRRAADLAAAIIRLCLQRGASDRIQYDEMSPASDALPSRRETDPGASPARRETHIGRNAPCPCGSGRKYKKCCGRTMQPHRIE
jgi:hypothetical protein